VELSVDVANVPGPATNRIEISAPELFLAIDLLGLGVGESAFPLPLPVPAGRTLRIHALEFGYTESPDVVTLPHHWAMQEVGPLTGPGSVVLDFSTTPAPEEATGSFDLPTRPASPLRTDFSFGWVRSSRSGTELDPGGHLRPPERIGCGIASSMTRSTDRNSIEYEMDWMPAPSGMEPITKFSLFRTWDWAGLEFLNRTSSVHVAGYPPEGHQGFTFLDVPEVTNPETAVVAHPLHGEPFEWNLFDSGVIPTLYVFRKIGDTGRDAVDYLWQITAPTDATSLVVPEPPSTIDAAAILGTRRLQARIGLYDPDPGDCLYKNSQSDPFIVQP
jgi:hypothetical protein